MNIQLCLDNYLDKLRKKTSWQKQEKLVICVSPGASRSNQAEMVNPRPAQEVINDAITENRYWEWICYGLVITFVLVGVGVIVCGLILENGMVTLAGSVAAALFWPALNHAVAIRRANISIRLLEVPLGKAKTAGQAADAIKEAFLSHFGKEKGNVAPKT